MLDTSVLSDRLRGDPRARQVITGLEAEGQTLSASVLTKVELLAGMRPTERSRTRKLIEAIDWLEVDDDLGERAGALASRFLRSHPGIELVDYVIAATAVGRVNVYLIEDDPLTLVDAGPNSGTSFDELQRGLESLGHALEEIELVILTHQHIDHLGLVGLVASRSGAEVAALDVAVPFV